MRSSDFGRIDKAVPVSSLATRPLDHFVDAIEAGKFLNLHWRTIQRLARENIIPAHSYGAGPRKTRRFLLSELDAWMRSQVNSACRP
jgi:excisionase family DNA binding protein